MQPTMRPVAQAVQSQGRGKDTMLMHMSPREVGGLQALALAHGGSLTINPQTGLPEAGFLENILPTLLGVGLSFIPGVGPMMAAGLVGSAQCLPGLTVSVAFHAQTVELHFTFSRADGDRRSLRAGGAASASEADPVGRGLPARLGAGGLAAGRLPCFHRQRQSGGSNHLVR